MSRQIVLDTETTGLSPAAGHKVIEIGLIELLNRRPTGRKFHTYLNPDREVDPGAERVHGISSTFLKDKPRFAEIVAEFINFIESSTLIIHNAPFDLGFLNNELSLIAHPWNIIEKHCPIIDTLLMARNKHRGQKNNLDALCKRYQIDNRNRDFHGALLDAELLAEVYLAMTGGQESFQLEEKTILVPQATIQEFKPQNSSYKIIHPSKSEVEAHEAYLARLLSKSGKCLWLEH